MNIFKKIFNKPKKELLINAPLSGELVLTSTVDDEVFAKDLMGSGIAIKPANEKIIAPVAGKMGTVFPTGHAYGIKTEQGFEVLIHIGIDTVELNGSGFKKEVEQDSSVEAGDLLGTVSLNTLKEAKKNPVTMIVILNESLGNAKIELVNTSGVVKQGEPIIRILY